MSKTAVADIIQPTLFEKYAIERTATLSQFFQSGVVVRDGVYDEIAATAGGKYVELPFWQDLTATRQILSDSSSLSVNKVAATKDTARIHNDAQAWSVNHLATMASGDDPMGAILQFVGQYWARVDDGLVISSLKGMFAAASMSGNLLGIHSESVAGQSTATRLNGSTFIDAVAKLGDCGDRLGAVAMHSATEAALKKLDLIDFLPDSQGKPSLKYFQGRRVIVDDSLTTRAGTTDGTVYYTYLFGDGAFVVGRAPLRLGKPRARAVSPQLRIALPCRRGEFRCLLLHGELWLAPLQFGVHRFPRWFSTVSVNEPRQPERHKPGDIGLWHDGQEAEGLEAVKVPPSE